MGDVRTGVVEVGGVDGQHAIARQSFGGVHHSDSFLHPSACQSHTLNEGLLERIVSHGAYDLVEVDALGLEIVSEDADQIRYAMVAGAEIEFYSHRIDAVEQRGDVRSVDEGALYIETEGRDATLCDEAFGFLVCRRAIVDGEVLTDQPRVADFRTAHVGELPGQRGGGGQSFDVFGAIKRIHIESFARFPNQFLLERHAL